MFLLLFLSLISPDVTYHFALQRLTLIFCSATAAYLAFSVLTHSAADPTAAKEWTAWRVFLGRPSRRCCRQRSLRQPSRLEPVPGSAGPRPRRRHRPLRPGCRYRPITGSAPARSPPQRPARWRDVGMPE